MTSGDYDFFGAPPTPPPSAPSAPAPAGQFGMPPAMNQFGLPVAPPTTAQFSGSGTPARHSAPTSGEMLHRSDTKRQLLLIGAVVVGCVLAVVAFMAATSQGKKTATAVDHQLLNGLAQAHTAELTADLRNAQQLQEAYLSEHSAYATSITDLEKAGFVASQSSRVTVVSGTTNTYCLRADDPSGKASSLYLSSTADISATPCT